MSPYFPKMYERCIGNVKVELDLSNYVTKKDLKGATCVGTSSLATKSDLGSLQAEVDKTEIDKLNTVPAALNK